MWSIVGLKILMTGADGYIGTNLTKYLIDRGFTVDEWSHDIRSFRIDGEYDYVIHLAALTGVRKSMEDPESYWEINVRGSKHVFGVCERHNIPLLFASSSNAREITNPYALTKYMNEIQKPPNSVGFRPHTVYPGRPDMLFDRLLNGKVDYINALHHRDFTHIDDLCAAIVAIIENYDKFVGQVLDIGNGKEVSVLEMASMMGFDGEVRFSDTITERKSTKADIKPLQSVGWEPKINIFDVINALYK